MKSRIDLRWAVNGDLPGCSFMAPQAANNLGMVRDPTAIRQTLCASLSEQVSGLFVHRFHSRSELTRLLVSGAEGTTTIKRWL